MNSTSPTTAEQGLAGFDLQIWFGVSAPAGTPQPVVLKLNCDLQQTLQTSEIRERFAALGRETEGGGPERFATLIREDIKRWRKVVKAGNVRTE